VPSGQTSEIIGVWAQILSGTSVTLNIENNGTTIPGLGALVVTTTKTYTSITALTLADGDVTYVAPTAVSGSPIGLSLVFAYKVVGT